jgi:hypothetical protein
VNGVCHGTPTGAVAETQNMAADADKVRFSWSTVSDATAYDALRGLAGPFPVGSSTAGEVCYPALTEAELVDNETPAAAPDSATSPERDTRAAPVHGERKATGPRASPRRVRSLGV